MTELSHTYTSPGTYVASLTLNGSASASVIIRVNKTLETATAKSVKVTLNFKQAPGFEDDQFAFTLKAPGLLEPKETVKAKLKSGAYEGLKMFVSVGGNEARTVEPTRIFQVELDERALARSGSNSLKYNPKTGEVKLSTRELALESIFEGVGLTRNTASIGRYMLPIGS